MPPVARRTPLLNEPCLLLALYTLFSGAAAYSRLTASKQGQDAVHEAALLLSSATSGCDVDAASAKRLGLAMLEALLQTPAGAFFAANLAAGCYSGLTLAIKTLFLGQLTASETSQLAERLLKFAAVKLVFLAIVRAPGHGDVMQWLAWFAVVAWFSMFTRLASLRGDALLCSPRATLAQHLRILLLLGGILAQDLSWVAAYLRSTRGTRDGSLNHALLWLFDAAFVAVDASYAIVKHGVRAWDHWQSSRCEASGQEREPWEGRTALVHHLDVSADLTLHCLSLAHHLHLWWQHGLQLQLVDGVLLLEVRMLAAAIRRRVLRHLAYLRLQRLLRHGFADAAPPQLAASPCCICLGSMKAGKLLPCSHVMHASCLGAWLQQHPAGAPPTCPMCRASLDISAPPTHVPAHPVGTASPCRASPPPSTAAPAPARPYTRLQARLAAAAAAGEHPGQPTTPATRHLRSMDGLLDGLLV